MQTFAALLTLACRRTQWTAPPKHWRSTTLRRTLQHTSSGSLTRSTTPRGTASWAGGNYCRAAPPPTPAIAGCSLRLHSLLAGCHCGEDGMVADAPSGLASPPLSTHSRAPCRLPAGSRACVPAAEDYSNCRYPQELRLLRDPRDQALHLLLPRASGDPAVQVRLRAVAGGKVDVVARRAPRRRRHAGTQRQLLGRTPCTQLADRHSSPQW